MKRAFAFTATNETSSCRYSHPPCCLKQLAKTEAVWKEFIDELARHSTNPTYEKKQPPFLAKEGVADNIAIVRPHPFLEIP